MSDTLLMADVLDEVGIVFLSEAFCVRDDGEEILLAALHHMAMKCADRAKELRREDDAEKRALHAAGEGI